MRQGEEFSRPKKSCFEEFLNVVNKQEKIEIQKKCGCKYSFPFMVHISKRFDEQAKNKGPSNTHHGQGL